MQLKIDVSHAEKTLIRITKPLTLIIFVKSIYVTLAVLADEEDMFENNTYNTAAQNLNEIEVTPPDDYSLIPATNWDNLPIRAPSMREMKTILRSPQGTRHTLDMPTRATIAVRCTMNQ